MTDVLLTAGTRKGLFIGRRRGGTWEITGPHFNAQAIYSVAVDTRGDTPRILVGGDSAHWGPSVFHSDDLGESWVEPRQPAVKFPKSTGASLERVWQLHPAGP
ncbi:exo-alpha-sialidase, partial [Streptomyces sp. SID7982]|nr:exo-alpha-sialidase [Streptomyces sp. SID7982]